MSFSFEDSSIKERCPLWSAPIVGTKPILAFLERNSLKYKFSSFLVLKTFIIEYSLRSQT